MKLLKLNSHPHNYTFFSTQTTMQTRAISRGTTLPPPCSSSRVTSPVTWSGAPLFTFTRASRWGPTWACPGVSDTTADNQVAPHGIFMFLLWKTSKLVFSLVLSAIQALRSVLNAFCVVNRKNMFVYQERTTKSVFYLRWVTSSAFFHISYWPIWAFQWMMLVSEEQSKQESMLIPTPRSGVQFPGSSWTDEEFTLKRT